MVSGVWHGGTPAARPNSAAVADPVSGVVADPVSGAVADPVSGAVADPVSAVWEILASVPDPEIPILGIVDLGIVRFVRQTEQGVLLVGITPTYSGCPATEVIRCSVREALDGAGYPGAVLEEVLAPPWTSDWLTPEGRARLREFGIAPPQSPVSSPRRLLGSAIACPRCGSHSTSQVSEFGSTPCKAHYRCDACLEPFDYFKCF